LQISVDPPEYVALEHVGCSVEKWAHAVQVLAKRLQLTADEQDELLLVSMRHSGQGYFQTPISEPGRIGLRITSYRTSQVDGEIHLVYGHLRLTGSVVVQEKPHTIQCRGRTFTVLPEASPYSRTDGTDMCGVTVMLPHGAMVVDTSDPDFAEICSQVIVPHGWNADLLSCRNAKRNAWPAYLTANSVAAGTCRFEDLGYMRPVGDSPLPTSFKFTGTSTSVRLLIELTSAGQVVWPTTKLSLQLTRFGELFARKHWAKQLGISAVTSDIGGFKEEKKQEKQNPVSGS